MLNRACTFVRSLLELLNFLSSYAKSSVQTNRPDLFARLAKSRLSYTVLFEVIDITISLFITSAAQISFPASSYAISFSVVCISHNKLFPSTISTSADHQDCVFIKPTNNSFYRFTAWNTRYWSGRRPKSTAESRTWIITTFKMC